MKYRRILLVVFFELFIVLIAAGPASLGWAEDPAKTGGAAAPKPTPVGPFEPDDALQHFQLAPGLRIELVASEPDVVDPVAVRFDERGRMWVVEMGDYPHGPADGEPPRSCIKVLEDRDGDGRYESVQVFADKLLFATGVQPWRDGVIATRAGEVAYLRDTDGDGRADHQETWYRGFAEENPQLRANHPRLGLDHHIYVANGLRGGQVVDARRADAEPTLLSGKDFRFHPTTFAYEAIGGVGQFGLTFDDYGRRFVCSNRNPLKHIVLEERYLRQNRGYAPAATAHDVAVAGADSRIFPISRAWTTSNLHAGQFTAACGALIFRGNAMPGTFYGNGFTCDPTGNLVHREQLQTSGATFTSHAARDGIEFLASTDEWFRPVNLAHGPDGALYVVDMYRAVIEHPQFMPDELKQRPDLLDGRDRGRIYRVTARPAIPTASAAGGEDSASDAVDPASKSRSPHDLSGLSSQRLAAFFEHPNAWQRETAARLVFERQDAEGVEPLRRIAIDGRHPAARVQALWALEGLYALDADILTIALGDPEPGVREQAVALCERHFADAPQLRDRVVALARDEEPRIRFQVALSLAPVQSDSEIAALSEIALASGADDWTRRAVAIAAGSHAAALALAVFAEPPWEAQSLRPTDLALLDELIPQVAAGERATQHELLTAIARARAGDQTDRLQRACLLSLADALTRRRASLAVLVADHADAEVAQAIRSILRSAGNTARDSAAPQAGRRAAIELLAFDADSNKVLIEITRDETDADVLALAIRALSRGVDDAPWSELVARYPAHSPTVRLAILDALLSRASRTHLLLDAVAEGHVKPGEIDRAQLNRLLKHRDADIRDRAAKLLAAAVPADRRQVLADYQACLQLAGDPARGREVFRRNCANCHRIGELGVNVAPDISDSRTKQPAQILADVLQPNRAIDNNFVSYSIATIDGRLLTGVIANETATSITLRQPEGKEATLLRDEVEEMRSNGVSLMPEGLEKEIPLQAMADVIAFIKNWRYLDGRIPLGNP